MKVMLISDLPPCNNHTSGLLINKQCDFLLEAGHSVSAFIVKADVVEVIIPEEKISRITFEMIRKPRENWGIWKLGKLGSVMGDIYVCTRYLPQIRKAIMRFIREMKPDIIWNPVQGQTMARLCRPVAQAAHIPYVVQIFDPINWWFQANMVDGFTQKRVMKEFGRTVHDAQCLIGASENMATVYKAQYGCRDSVPIMMPFSTTDMPKKSRNKKEASEFVIALTGQLYAYGTILGFLLAIDQMGWTYKGKRIIFRVYGANMHFDMNHACNLEYRGWTNQETLLSELTEVDLLYCPYRFDPDFEETARLAFPGKLSTYMTTGVPVLAHGPYYSSITNFLRSRNAGYILESLEVADIIKKLEEIMEDPKRFQYAENARDVLKNELSSEVMRDNFFHALGISSGNERVEEK